MHTAVEVKVVLERCPLRVASLAAWGDKCIVGTPEGNLLILAELPQQGTTPAHYEAVDTRKSFAKKPITQMQVLEDLGFLLSLSEHVAVHTLDDFSPVAVLSKSKSATLFKWSQERATLCVALKKRLLIYKFNGLEFQEVKEVPLNDTPRDMAWCGGSMCLGLTKQYVLLDVASGQVTEVFPTGRLGAVSILELESSELMLTKDCVGVFVGPEGKPSRRHGLAWSDTPLAAAAMDPYVVAMLPRHLEVRTLSARAQQTLVQTLPLRDVRFMAAPPRPVAGEGDGDGETRAQCQGPIFVSSTTSIHRLVQVPLAEQVEQLARSGEFEEAISLCHLLPGEDSAQSEARRMLHLRFAHSLFTSGDFADAMHHFSLASSDPFEVLALFPSMAVLPPNRSAGHPYSQQSSQRPPGDDDFKAAPLQAPVKAAPLAALLTYLQAWRDATSAHPANQDLRDACGIVDTAILRAMIVPGAAEPGAAMAFLDGAHSVIPDEGEAALLAAGRYAELVQLYRTNNMHRRALELLRRLFQHPLDMHPPPPYPSPFTPQATVDYLVGLPAAGEATFEPDDSRDRLVLEYSRWVLDADAQQGLALFARMHPPLPLEVALPHVKSHAPAVALEYLEKELAARGHIAHPEFHNELVMMFLEAVNRERAAGGAWAELQHSPVRTRMLAFLQAPASRFAPERMLARFPVDALFEERALLLWRIRRHRSALTIYVHRLRDPALAEAYCQRVHAAAGGEEEQEAVDGEGTAADIYSVLLQVYLAEDAGEKVLDTVGIRWGAADGLHPRQAMIQEALGVLSRHQDRIDGERALVLLPSETPLCRLLPFLEGMIRARSEARRNASVVKSLRRYEHLKVIGTRAAFWHHLHASTDSFSEVNIGGEFKFPDSNILYWHNGWLDALELWNMAVDVAEQHEMLLDLRFSSCDPSRAGFSWIANSTLNVYIPERERTFVLL